jgi:hypothetical protein
LARCSVTPEKLSGSEFDPVEFGVVLQCGVSADLAGLFAAAQCLASHRRRPERQGKWAQPVSFVNHAPCRRGIIPRHEAG